MMRLKGNRTMIAGDFNRIGFGRTDTDPRLSTSRNLLDFLNQHQQILNDPDTPTRGQAVLDLACSSIPGARVYVDHKVDVGSDHTPLTITIPGPRIKQKTPTLRRNVFQRKSLLNPNEEQLPPFVYTYLQLEQENPPQSIPAYQALIQATIQKHSKRTNPNHRPNTPSGTTSVKSSGRA